MPRALILRMDELYYFLKDMKAPEELSIRAREHFRSTRTLYKKMSYKTLFTHFSPQVHRARDLST